MQRGRNGNGPNILLLLAGFLLQNGGLVWTVKGPFIVNKIHEISLQPVWNYTWNYVTFNYI